MAAVWESGFASHAPRASRHVGAAIAIGLHAAAVGALLSYEPARTALVSAAPIMVDWIAPPKVEPKIEPPTQLPKPKPVKPIKHAPPRKVEAPPVVAAPPEAPAPVVAPAPPPPAPEPVAAVPVPPPAPVTETPPVFNAHYLDNPQPAYPGLSRRLREQGRVMLRVLVSAAGAAQEVQVKTSSGFPRLDDAALQTVRSIQFVPAKRGAEAVSAWVLIPISFKLEG